jgi:hypothetical protein
MRAGWEGAFIGALGGLTVIVLQACTLEDRVQYLQDSRTGLCFAAAGHALAHVPCAPAVLALVGK